MTAWKETRARETRDERCELARCGGPGSSSSPPPRSRWPLAAWRWDRVDPSTRTRGSKERRGQSIAVGSATVMRKLRKRMKVVMLIAMLAAVACEYEECDTGTGPSEI